MKQLPILKDDEFPTPYIETMKVVGIDDDGHNVLMDAKVIFFGWWWDLTVKVKIDHGALDYEYKCLFMRDWLNYTPSKMAVMLQGADHIESNIFDNREDFLSYVKNNACSSGDTDELYSFFVSWCEENWE